MGKDMTVGERVLELVHSKNMTQKEFSTRTGIPQSTMSSWKGKKQNPSLDKLKVICDTLEIDPYYLISGGESNERLNTEYLKVYRGEEDYDLVMKYRKLDEKCRNRLVGYMNALTDLEAGK